MKHNDHRHFASHAALRQAILTLSAISPSHVIIPPTLVLLFPPPPPPPPPPLRPMVSRQHKEWLHYPYKQINQCSSWSDMMTIKRIFAFISVEPCIKIATSYMYKFMYTYYILYTYDKIDAGRLLVDDLNKSQTGSDPFNPLHNNSNNNNNYSSSSSNKKEKKKRKEKEREKKYRHVYFFLSSFWLDQC